jgi:hypothetical protein
MAKSNLSPIERFESKFIPEPNSGCWLWIGAGTNTVGRFDLNGKLLQAARAAWQFYRGPIPDGMQINHKCDNGLCVNPDHLYPGTQARNMLDRKERGRWAGGWRAGAAHVNAKLTQEQAIQIASSKKTSRALAAEYGISQSQAFRIKAGQRWPTLRREQ